jgi:hypothetical protein
MPAEEEGSHELESTITMLLLGAVILAMAGPAFSDGADEFLVRRPRLRTGRHAGRGIYRGPSHQFKRCPNRELVGRKRRMGQLVEKLAKMGNRAEKLVCLGVVESLLRKEFINALPQQLHGCLPYS